MAADIPVFTSWSTTAGSNQPDASDSIANIDDNFQQIQAEVRKYVGTKGADIASASTVNLAAATGNYVHITGTTTVTALGTVAAGIRMLLVFDGALTFTHNATSLILPGAANITTAAGDRCEVVSLGSGNWRCLWYQKASGVAVSTTGLLLAANDLSDLADAATARTNLGLGTSAVVDTGTASGNVPLVGTKSATDVLAGLVELATTDEVVTGTATDVVATPAGVTAAIAAIPNQLTLGTPVASTSGTAIDFTSIPAGTKRITIGFNGVSLNSTSNPLIQIGDSGGVETTGYTSASGYNITGTTLVTSSAGFVITHNGSAANVSHGSIILTLMDATNNTWVCSGVLNTTGASSQVTMSGVKSLSAALDRVRITSVSGTDTFDAGVVNIIYE